MDESPGNTFKMMENALERGLKGVTVTAEQMRQILREVAYLVAAKNHLVRLGLWDELKAETDRDKSGSA